MTQPLNLVLRSAFYIPPGVARKADHVGYCLLCDPHPGLNPSDLVGATARISIRGEQALRFRVLAVAFEPSGHVDVLIDAPRSAVFPEGSVIQFE